jgi:hypothetical protein
MHRYTAYNNSLANPPLTSRSCVNLPLFIWPNPSFYLLGEPASLLVMRIPIHSYPWFAINCSPLAASPTPRHPTDQFTYLHRRFQHTHQLFRLKQVRWIKKNRGRKSHVTFPVCAGEERIDRTSFGTILDVVDQYFTVARRTGTLLEGLVRFQSRKWMIQVGIELVCSC